MAELQQMTRTGISKKNVFRHDGNGDDGCAMGHNCQVQNQDTLKRPIDKSIIKKKKEKKI